MADQGLSRMAAGKQIEDVQRGVRRAKMNLVSGGMVWAIGVGLFLVIGGGLLTWGLVLAGTFQIAAGLRTLRAYQKATYTPIPSPMPSHA